MVAAADGSLTGQTPGGDTLRVREVWQDNLEAEMKVGARAGVRFAVAGAGQDAWLAGTSSGAVLVPFLVSGRHRSAYCSGHGAKLTWRGRRGCHEACPTLGLQTDPPSRAPPALVQLIRDVVDEYPYLAMDTEFPGVVARPVGSFKNSGEYHYQTLRQAGCATQGGEKGPGGGFPSCPVSLQRSRV